DDLVNGLSILPVPKEVNYTQGQMQWPASWQAKGELPQAEDWINRLLQNVEGPQNRTIVFIQKTSLASEAYELFIRPKAIEINYAQPAGAYFALVTLHHLQVQFPDAVPCMEINDAPDLEVRGIMHDISRDKVPTLTTLKALVDDLSLLKYNHLQLYVEGFSFAYPSFKNLWQGEETPITPEEIRALDQYCKERFITLVANQNSLGHMQAWLETPEYEHLAECPKGYAMMPMLKMKTTLDPSNPESIELIEKMMDDMLPNFSAPIFNANLDEPFELGKCKTEDLAEEIGVGQIYLDHVKKVYELTQKHNKSMWMWADIVGKHPEILEDLPKDITLLEWGYEQEHPFDKNTKRIKENGLDFIVCPGTSSWLTFGGRTDNMLGNIENAVSSGVQNGAKGMLLTDWGDFGHWQYLPMSYPSFAYAGAVSWNSETMHALPLQTYLNQHWFDDEKEQMAGLLLETGRSYHFEEMHMPNMSNLFMAYQFGIMDPIAEEAIMGAMSQKLPELIGEEVFSAFTPRFENQKSFEIDALQQHLSDIELKLNENASEQQLQEYSQVLQVEELRNTVEMIRLGGEIRQFGQEQANWTSEQRIAYLQRMQTRLDNIQLKHRELWLTRNKAGGLDRSMKAFVSLEKQIDGLIFAEEKGGIFKGMNGLKNRMMGGGLSWYFGE
ncbi:MAG: family 20 glycosylhydrolase, partial [Bacteroidota bacterium]